MSQAFTVVLRGYDRSQVDRLLTQADQALASGSETARLAALQALNGPMPGVSFRGYDRDEVDRALKLRRDQLAAATPFQPSAGGSDRLGGAQLGDRPLSPAARPDPPEFTIVLRGYAVPEVDSLFTQADDALASGSETSRAAARQALVTADFPVSLRGYDRRQVDQLIQARLRLLTEAG